MPEKAHSAFYVYLMLFLRAPKLVFIDLKRRKKTKGDWIIIASFVFLACFGGAWGGFYMDTHYISPPTPVYGVCAYPAYVINDNCYQRVTIQTTISGTATEVTETQTAGYLLNPYGNQSTGVIHAG